jgi:beta-glucosidase
LPLLDPYIKTDKGEMGYVLQTYDKPHTDKDRKLLDTRTLESIYLLVPDYLPCGPDKPFYFQIDAELEVPADGEYDFGVVVSGTAALYIDGELVVDNTKDQEPSDNFFGAGTAEKRGSVQLKADKKYKLRIQFGSFLTSTLNSEVPAFGGGLRVGMVRKQGVDDLINEAVQVAKCVDQVVLSLGLNSDWESEGYDRRFMDFPPNVDKLVDAIMKVNKNVVVVNQSGTPVTLPWIDSVPAFVQAWYGGNETGNGIADVLFGDVNPSGRLPLTFPVRLEDNPAYLSYRNENGRVWYSEDVYAGYKHYEAAKREPLFPFGHGLSYTTFEFKNGNVVVDGDKVVATVDVSNTGKIDGRHVVQVYVAQKNPSIGRPPKELKGFAKVDVKSGETKTATIEIPLKYATSFWHEIRDCWVSEADDYDVLFGHSSSNIGAQASFKVAETTYWNGI